MGLTGLVGKLMAVVAVLAIAVGIAVVPSLLYTALPAEISKLDLTKPTTIVVTGANSGLGLATVQNFAHNEKATIIMACRSMSRCQTAKEKILHNNLPVGKAKATLRLMNLDLSQKSSIEAFATELQGQPIDMLINNAGLSGATPELSYHPQDGVETHIRVNHLGAFYLTHCLWKNLLQSNQGGRVVMVSSVLAAPASNAPTFGWYKEEPKFDSGWNIRQYGCSKRANLFFANELHHRYKDTTTVTVTAAHPGFTHTDICKDGCKGTGKNYYSNVGRYFQNLESITGIIKMTAQEGSLSQAYAAIIPQSNVYIGPSLVMVGEPKILGTLDNSWHHMSFTREESKQLWEKSMKAMNIHVFGDFVIPPPPPVERVEEEEQEEEEGVQEEAQEERVQGKGEVEEAFPPEATDEQEDGTATATATETNSNEEEEDDDDEYDDEENNDEDSSEDDEEAEIWNTYLGDGEYKEAMVM